MHHLCLCSTNTIYKQYTIQYIIWWRKRKRRKAHFPMRPHPLVPFPLHTYHSLPLAYAWERGCEKDKVWCMYVYIKDHHFSSLFLLSRSQSVQKKKRTPYHHLHSRKRLEPIHLVILTINLAQARQSQPLETLCITLVNLLESQISWIQKRKKKKEKKEKNPQSHLWGWYQSCFILSTIGKRV